MIMKPELFLSLRQKIILVGGDHHARDLSEVAYKYLKKQGLNVKMVTYNEKLYDYIHQANLVAKKVSANPGKYCGIVGCNNGFGVTTVCNKYPSVYAVRCDNQQQARKARIVNYSNVLTFGASFQNEQKIKKIIDLWLCTDFELSKKNTSRLKRLFKIEQKLNKSFRH